jgi:hypothetical protein
LVAFRIVYMSACLGWSEPAPMTAPVGRSVHRMGCVFH